MDPVRLIVRLDGEQWGKKFQLVSVTMDGDLSLPFAWIRDGDDGDDDSEQGREQEKNKIK